jgi:GT2 family glycosyltransferase
MVNPRVAIIILNWNGWLDTIECIESVYQITYQNYQVIVVDNNSSDDSIKKIEDYSKGELSVESKFFNYTPHNQPIEIVQLDEDFKYNKDLINDKPLILIKNKDNYGFAEGNNIGIRFALKNLNPDYILLLNNDTVVDKDFLMPLVLEGEKNKKTGFLGPKIYYYDNPNIIWCVGGKIDWKFARGLHIGINTIDNGQYEERKNFDYISGSSLLIKREVIDNVGLLDKNYFLYFEETDLAFRAKEKGYESLYVPNSKIWHKISKSGGGISNPIGLYYITRNRWLFMKKWAHKDDYFIFVILQVFMAILLPTFMSVYYKNKKLFHAYYTGFFDGIIH